MDVDVVTLLIALGLLVTGECAKGSCLTSEKLTRPKYLDRSACMGTFYLLTSSYYFIELTNSYRRREVANSASISDPENSCARIKDHQRNR